MSAVEPRHTAPIFLRASDPPRPDAKTVHRIHDRYLVEVVEGLNLCPFARRSRQLGRVHRPLLWCTDDTPPPSARAAAQVLHEVALRHGDAEIVLITFVTGDQHPFCTYEAFEAYVREVRDHHAATSPATPFFMVGFHPTPESNAVTNPHALVPLLRRSPDPVIQCVSTKVLEAVREEAQVAARNRLERTLDRLDPALRSALPAAILTDSQLSADIASANFETWQDDAKRLALEEALASIASDRRQSYLQETGLSEQDGHAT